MKPDRHSCPCCYHFVADKLIATLLGIFRDCETMAVVTKVRTRYGINKLFVAVDYRLWPSVIVRL